jgi:hypothetical protein
MISKTRSVSPARKLRSDPGFPHISPKEMCHARPALLTVFSIIQSEHSITLMSIQDNTDFEMHLLPLYDLLSAGGDDILRSRNS